MKNDSIEIAAKLGISLKKVSTFKGHEGMTGINADICLDGKPFAHAYDDACGGEMDIRPEGYTKENREIIQSLSEKIQTFPTYDLNVGGKIHKVKHTLEDVVNALVDAELLKKSMKKDEKKGIVYEEDGKQMISSWKGFSLDTLVKHPQGRGILQAAYMGLKIRKGVTILNLDYLKKVGVEI